jgi:hypothetical protein
VIADEVIQHLINIGEKEETEPEITLEIQVKYPNGILESNKICRDIDTNCYTLKFIDHGFEEN